MSTQLIEALYQIGAIQFGEFKLKSGQTSSLYINLRKIISYPSILRLVAEAIWESNQDKNIKRICGVPYTALPIATCISLKHNLPMIMRRKEKKEYGTKQAIEGEYQTGERCLIVEDVVTTGSSIIETANELEAAGLTVASVTALIDREQGGEETLQKKYAYNAVLPITAVLQTLLNGTLVTNEERDLIKQFLESA